MTDFDSKVTAFLTERRKTGDGWTSIAEIREHVKPPSQTKVCYSLSCYVRLVPGIEMRGGWELWQQFQVRMKESA
jgi:hypothetical protein